MCDGNKLFLSIFTTAYIFTCEYTATNFYKIFGADENSDCYFSKLEIDSHICQNDTHYLRVTLSPPGVKNPVVDNAFFLADLIIECYTTTINFFFHEFAA